jgi:hypothetical protein
LDKQGVVTSEQSATEAAFKDPDFFYGQLLPFIQKLVLKTPELFKDGLNILCPQVAGKVVISREQTVSTFAIQK